MWRYVHPGSFVWAAPSENYVKRNDEDTPQCRVPGDPVDDRISKLDRGFSPSRIDPAQRLEKFDGAGQLEIWQQEFKTPAWQLHGEDH